MPDATHGVPVWRIKWRNPQEQSFHHYLDQQRSANVIGSEPGTWYHADEDSARSEIIAAAFAVRAIDSDSSRAHRDACARLIAAVTRLEAI